MRNRATFERVVGPYVSLKLADKIARRGNTTRKSWFDASGCVWCLFDDEGFVRSGCAGRDAKAAEGDAFDLQVFWSLEDVLMPAECDERWVAGRIADDAMRLLTEQGFRCKLEERMTGEGRHLGVRFCRPLGLRRVRLHSS